MSVDVIRNAEAEACVLGSIILEGDLIKDCRLQISYFSHPVHRTIFKIMRTLDENNEPIDLVAIVSKLDPSFLEQIGGIDFLIRLTDTVSNTANFQYHEGLILESWKLRQAKETVDSLSEQLSTERNTAAIAEAVEKLSEIEETGYSADFDLKSTLVELYDEMQQDYGDLTGISMGYQELNRMTNGLQEGDLIIIGARPSMGKTAFALNVAYHAANTGTVVGFFSLEMKDKKLLKRMISLVGNVDGQKMQYPKQRFNLEDWTKSSRAFSIINELPIDIYDKASISVQEIRAKTRALKRKHPDKKLVIFIDYLQLITEDTSKYKGNRQQEMGEVSRKLKMMAMDLEVAVVALSQLSRGVESRQDKRPLLSDLRETGQIEQDADLIAFLYRDDYYDKESESKNITEVIIAKQRNGPVGTVQLAFIREYSKFVSLERRTEGQAVNA